MSINLKAPEVVIRETRLGSITGYEGTAKGLCEGSKGGRMCDRERSFSQCLGCSSLNALCQLLMIQDAAVINHGPIGCAADFAEFNFTNRVGQRKRGLPLNNGNVLSTNLKENDMVYGGGAKLEAAIREAWTRFHPRAIFITTSCASGIIADDVSGISDRLQRELGIPVISVTCEGFRSKLWTTGFDAAYHAILRKIVKPPTVKSKDLVNVINFWGTDVFTDLFGKIGLRPNYIVPFTTVAGLEKISEAVATVEICPTLGTYLAAALEQEYGVPEVKAPPPYGLKGSDEWFRELGRVTGKEKEAERLIASERERIGPELESLRKKLRGKRVYVTAGAAHGHSLLSILKELEMDVVGAGIFHHDPCYDNQEVRGDVLSHVVTTYGDVKNFNICNKQVFEMVNILNRLRPDVFVARHGGLSVWGVKLGIPTFLMGDEQFGLGYQGILNYGNKILDTLTTKAFVENIAAHSELPYTDWWLGQKATGFMRGKQ
jgi:nitrogenase molybdenum-iron protein alpha chain